MVGNRDLDSAPSRAPPTAPQASDQGPKSEIISASGFLMPNQKMRPCWNIHWDLTVSTQERPPNRNWTWSALIKSTQSHHRRRKLLLYFRFAATTAISR